MNKKIIAIGLCVLMAVSALVPTLILIFAQ